MIHSLVVSGELIILSYLCLLYPAMPGQGRHETWRSLPNFGLVFHIILFWQLKLFHVGGANKKPAHITTPTSYTNRAVGVYMFISMS